MEAVKSAKQNKSVYSEMVDITPEYAEKLLKRNTINRPLNTVSVSHYAKQMKDGKWCAETDESVKISIDGVVLDGQHRLSAVIKAGIPVKMKITHNLPGEIFKFIDQGKKRTAGDILHISDVPNAQAIAGIIKSAITLSSGQGGGSRGAVKLNLSNDDMYNAYMEKPQYWQDLHAKVGKWYRAFHHVLKPAFLGGHFHIFADKNIEAAEIFMDKLCLGIGLTETDPVRVVREYFLKQLDLKGKKINTAQYNSAMIIKGWNLYRQNKTISFMRWDSAKESYPKPI